MLDLLAHWFNVNSTNLPPPTHKPYYLDTTLLVFLVLVIGIFVIIITIVKCRRRVNANLLELQKLREQYAA